MPEPFPEDAVPPGETLLETIQYLGVTQAGLAQRMGRPLKTINEIIRGKAAITPETALQLQHALGTDASFWNERERRYRETLARQEEEARLKQSSGWLKQLPVKELLRRKLIKQCRTEAGLMAEVLRFFGVSSPKAWDNVWNDVAFRRSPAFTASPGAMAAWLRIGELQAQTISCQPFNATAFKRGLDRLRSLSLLESQRVKTELVNRCKAWGVAVTFTAELPKTHVSGATQWLNPDKALIQLSCRFKADDHFWFTFFHEAGHILLHGKKDAFIDAPKTAPAKEEEEANTFAANALVPPAMMRAFLKNWQRDESGLRAFAKELGIAPGIVVGQLQHADKIGYHEFNQLKRYEFDLTN